MRRLWKWLGGYGLEPEYAALPLFEEKPSSAELVDGKRSNRGGLRKVVVHGTGKD